jgi:hypothetical protein
MKAAIYSGVLASNLISLPAPPFNCPTGNCTWDPYATLSVSSQCIDVTSSVTLNCTGDAISEGCNFAAPEDPTLQKLLNGTGSFSIFMIESGIANEFLPVLKPYTNMVGFLSMVQWVKALDLQPGQRVYSNTTYEAVRCIFYLSVREVLVQVSNGVYSEKLLQEYTRPENISTTPTYALNGTDYYFMDPFDFNFPDLVYKPPFARGPPNLNDTFVVPYHSFAMLSSLLIHGDFLNGEVTQAYSSGISGPDIPLMLYQANNVTHAMYTMAEYITTLMRASDSDPLEEEYQNASLITPAQAVTGAVWVQKQFVTVRWAWLTLPAVLLILAILFLLAVFLETQRSCVGLWQSSPLTLFFHGQLSDRPQSIDWKAGSLNTANAMQDSAADLCARIPKDSPGTIEVYPKSDMHGRSRGSAGSTSIEMGTLR